MEPFEFRDGERLIVFGRGRAAEASSLCGGAGFTLLTTARGLDAVAGLAQAAATVREVPGGLVDEIAGDMLDAIDPGARLVALGGGRVIDVAKALAAARGATVTAIPTTLSGAEMTRGHRHARGVEPVPENMRPQVVVNDPALTASQPIPELAASALNALGHAVEGPLTPLANPIATLAAHEGARLLCGAFPADDTEPDRDALALGALLAGYAIDSAGYGLHHVLAQTLVRVGGVAHATANAILLPHTIAALAARMPQRIERLAAALGADPASEAARLCAISGPVRLSHAGVSAAKLDAVADAAALRQQNLAQTPPAADRGEIRAIYERAF